jgi:hypothetical protein
LGIANEQGKIKVFLKFAVNKANELQKSGTTNPLNRKFTLISLLVHGSKERKEDVKQRYSFIGVSQ